MASHRISEDLLVEILKRLPVKSLLRFKATSETWCSLIKSAYFIKSHLASAPDRVLIHPNRNIFLFPDDGSQAVNLTHGLESVKLNTDQVIDFNQLGIPSARFVLCNGPIVCLFGGFTYDATPPITPITLWNPATRKFKSLPTSNYRASIDIVDIVGTGWKVGIGFDSKSNDHKVVALISLWAKGELKPSMNYAEVYSLKTNSWRVILIDEVVAPIFHTITPSTYTQGVCYWMAYLDNAYVLVSFDMEEEVFRVIPAPPFKKPIEIVRLVSSNESIVVLSQYSNNCSPIEVWAMKDLFALGGDFWSLEYILEQHAWGVPPFYNFCPFGLWNNCLLFIQYGEGVRKICLYNPGTREISNLEFSVRISNPRAYSYKETLVSLA